MTTWWLRTLAIGGFLAVSCSSANQASAFPATPSAGTATSNPTISRTPYKPSPSYPSPGYPPQATASSAPTQPCPDVLTVPQFQPSAATSRNLALVQLGGSNRTVVLDITDINHPVTVTTLDIPSSTPSFASATDVSWIWADAVPNLLRLSYAGSSTTVVAHCAFLFDWSPDGTTAVYMGGDSGSELHQVSGGRDRVLASVQPFPPVGGCESPSCAYSWDFRLLYSPDGSLISLVESTGQSVIRVWTADGRILWTADSDSAITMPVWSGDTLYYRDAVGVDRWRNGTRSVVLSGVFWIRPKASPAGGQIVFEQLALGAPDVLVLDIASGSVRPLGQLRSEPVFLTSRYIWYKGERPCVAGDGYPCTSGGLTIASGKTYIYDLQTGTETESTITNVSDVWPHPA
jgi:hypothetical protein